MVEFNQSWAKNAAVLVVIISKKEDLPPDLQEREAPSDRKPLAELIMEGGFKMQ